ncbi:SixA phosphatase family protein [Yeosuana sp. AK3]
MKITKSVISVLFLLFFSCENKQNNPTTNEDTPISTYYFIRHAEKDRSDATNKNPHLLEIGKQRADKWSQVLKNIAFDAVYSTNYHRTKETALPTAKKNNLELTLYNPKTTEIEKFLKDTEGKNVLVVGHSNTIPDFVNFILKTKKYKDIEDNNNSNLYIITVYKNHISDVLLYINNPL